MIPIKSFINIMVFSLALLFTSCVKDSGKKDEVKGSPEIVNRLIANNITPSDFPSKTQSIVTLSYTSVDNELASSCVLSQLAHVTLTQACSCDQLGVCTVGVTGEGGYMGAGSFAYNVVAGGKTSTTGKAQFFILAPPPGSNVPPTISNVPAKTTTEGVAASGSFTVADSDSVVTCSNVTAASSNTTVVPNANIVISGSSTSCTVVITPAAGQVGSSNITLTLTDTGSPLPAQTATTAFTLTVNGFNDPPTISTVSAQFTNEDTVSSAIAFTIGDIDSVVTCGDVSATSSNSGVVTNSNITIGGTAPNCTITLAPNLNSSGSTNIVLSLTDHGMPMPAKTVTSNFALTVVPVNDVPQITGIPAQNTTENVSKTVNFTITDVDSNLSCTSGVVITSSNTTLVPNTNISVSGIAPNCTATITPAANQSGTATLTATVSDNGFPMPIQTASTSFIFQVAQVNDVPTISVISNQVTNEDTATSAIAFTITDTDSTIYCSNVTGVSSNPAVVPSANIVVSGTAPNCTAVITPTANTYGSTTITLTLNDNGTPMPSQTATSVFVLTINAVNDAPTISAIGAQSTNEGTASSAIAFTINDSDSSLSCTSSVAASSSNTTLIPNANVVFSGTAPNCSAVVTPVAGLNGTATITFTLTDNGTPLPALTATSAFVMTVNEINQAPMISAITNQATDEDTATSGIAFTIVDADSTVYCNDVTGVSSNTTLVPNANIVITGTAPNCVATITPALNAYGTSSITLTLTDHGTPLPAQTATSIFTLTVNAVNDAPTISAITNKTTDEDTATAGIAFTIADIDSSVTCAGSVSKASSNTTIIPVANIVISGTAPNCSAVITPAADQSGTSTVTLTLTDNGTPMPAQTATSVFNVTVNSIPDLTGTLTVAANLSGVASSYASNSYARIINFTGLTSDEALSSVEVCLGTAAGSCDVSSWVEATGYTTSGSAPTVTLGGSYRLRSGIGGAQVFTLSASCGATNSYYYSIRGTNSSSRVSNVTSTPAWTFWEPTCLGSTVLAQWLDASEPSTMTIATGVSSWTDKSGNGRTVTQATAAKRPVFAANGLGTGLPGLTFNGTQTAANGSSLGRASFVHAQGATSIFTVIKAAAINANRYIFSEGNTGTTSNVSYSPFMTSTTNTITGQLVNNANVSEVNLPTTSTTFFNNTVRLGMIEDSGSTYYTYSNGVAQSQAATNYTRAASTLNTYRIGARFRNNAETGWIAGIMGEFVVTNGVLSTLNRQKLEGYSAHKWNVSGSLPGGHPYSTTPP